MNSIGHKIQKISNFGTQEPWVARITFSLLDLASHLSYSKKQNDEINKWLFEISKELNAAFEALTEVDKLEKQKNSALYSKNAQYQNLYSALWRAYKDRFQKACERIGYNIGFLFEDDSKFERKSLDFIKNNPEIPDNFRKMLKIDRRIWQNGLSQFRNNYIEHKAIGEGIENIFFRPDSARKIFENVWQAIEDSVVVFINTKIKEPFEIYEIPEKDRDKACPERFRIGLSKKALESLKNSQKKS